MAYSLAQLAQLVDGALHGDGELMIAGAAILRDAQPGEITYCLGPEHAKGLEASAASAVLLPPGMSGCGMPFVTVEDVAEAFTRVVYHFRPPRLRRNVGISPAAHVSRQAKIAPDVQIHPLATVGDDVTIGPRCVIHAGVHIMAGCKIAEDVTIFPGAVLYEDTLVGPRCIIHAGAVLGAYGFGYETKEGRHVLSPQLGYVVLEADVELGACSTIDRGTYGPTLIGEGTKIDNHVQIAHNCRIGRHNILCSQVGIAGSSTTGDYVVMGGQVGVRDHVHVGDQATLGAMAGVVGNVPAGETYLGIPATPVREQKLRHAALSKLPEMRKEFRELQKQVEDLLTRASTQKAA